MIRDPQLSDQGAFIDRGVNPTQKFSTLLVDLLKQYQGMGTKSFSDQGFNAQDAQTQRVTQTPQDLIGAAPNVQAGVRSAAVGAVQPTITGARVSGQTFSEQLRSFGDTLGGARDLLKEYQAQEESLKERASTLINFALESGGSAGLEALMQSQPDIFKKAGFDSKTIQGLIPAIRKQESLKNAKAGTEGDKDLAHINAVESKLLNSKKGGLYVDGNVYLQERRTSRLDGETFDERFAALLSPGDRQKYGISSSVGGPDGAPESQIKTDARSSAQQLMDRLVNKKGTTAVGKSSIFNSFGYGFIPGTDRADFVRNLNNLKSLLSLDNVKLLKGQGQVSDAERRLLEEASSQLDGSQSESQFKATLENIIRALGGASGGGSETKVINGQTYEKVGPDQWRLKSNDPSTSRKGSLGSLSAKYESGGKAGAYGYDSTGGHSYGTHQLTKDSLAKFVKESRFGKLLAGLNPASEKFKQTWQAIANKYGDVFKKEQEDFIVRTHYQPQVSLLQKIGLNLNRYSDTLKEVVYSTAVQHGANTDVIKKAIARVGKNASEAQLVRAIYAERRTRFPSSTPQVRAAVMRRLDSEMNDALRRLS